MPGFAGIVTRKPASKAKAELAEMLKVMQHEPFYVTGSWTEENLGFYLGWVLRDGPLPELPVRSESGNVLLFFSGDDPLNGLRYQGHSERGVILGGAVSRVSPEAENQDSFLVGLNGMFHGVFVNMASRSIALFNDRYGLQRLYVHEALDGFYFAPEAKAIHAVQPATRDLDIQGLGELLAFGCVVDNRSLFSGIKVLPGGSRWEIRQGVVAARGTYFHPREWEDQVPSDSATYYRDLRDIVSGIFPRYTNDLRNVAVALTGGLDTRLIMAWSGAEPFSLPCYTFGGSLRESRDVQIARRVAGLCRQKHTVITVGSRFLRQFERYAGRTVWMSDGTVSPANACDLYLSEEARGIRKLKLVGTWGSELLRETVTFKPRELLPGLFTNDIVQSCRNAADTYQRVRRCHPLTFAAFRQTSWAQYGVEALEQTQVGILAPFLNQEFVKAAYRAPSRHVADVRLRLIEEASPLLARVPTDRGGPVSTRGLAAHVLRGIQEFTFKAEYALDTGMPQALARSEHIFRFLGLRQLFLGRHKFTHFRVWYQNELASYVRETLLSPLARSRPLFESNTLERVVESHLSGRSNHTNLIHTLLSLEIIQRKLASC